MVRRGLDVEGFGVFDTEYANQTLTESVEDRDGFEDIFARGRGILVRKYGHHDARGDELEGRAEVFDALDRLVYLVQDKASPKVKAS